MEALRAVFELYPLGARPKPWSYGTSGFRGPGETLISVACRMGPFMAIRCIAAKGPCTGICFTASHNPSGDNGLKQIDVTGEMLPEEWEPYAEAVTNAATSSDCVKSLQDLMEKFAVTADMLKSAVVHLGRDTRPTGIEMTAACKAALEAVGAQVIDYGIVTTPQLHVTVEASADKGADYLSTTVEAFKILYRPSSPQSIPEVLVDCSNGVGSLRMKDFAERLQGVLKLTAVNTDVEIPTILNEKCGADFVQKELKWPTGMQARDSTCCHQVSIDGDADRVVFMVPHSSSPGSLALLDGDRILVLFASYIRSLLDKAGLSLSSRLVVVQTAYANGGSTNYLRDTLRLPVTLVPTGVKYCHAAAKEGAIGIFFEANGHGTVLFSSSFLKMLREDPAPTTAHAQLLALSQLLSQVCGDAITDMLAVEVVLAAFGWTLETWLSLYTDLPSRQLKVTVPDPQRLKTCWDQTRVVSPEALQTEIDQAVKPYAARGPARCFVRPSGTEPIVRVYAEATTREECDALAEEVKLLVTKHLGIK